MPFTEFTPILDEKFKYASFGLTRLNGESIFSLIVTSSSLTLPTPSFVSGSLVPQTSNSQTFDVYSVVSITGAGANPFTLNSNGTYNYQIPTPLPTTNLVLTYQVTRGTKTATATLTLVFNPFPLCTIEDPNTSDFNLKIYHSAGSSISAVNPANTFDGLTYPRPQIVGLNISASFSFTPAGVYTYYKWIPEDPTQTGSGGVIFSTPGTWGVASITYSSGSFRISLRYGGAASNWGVWFMTPLTPNAEVIISHGTPILPDLSNFSMTIGGVPATFLPTTQANGFNGIFSSLLAFNSNSAIGCFLAAVERPADFKVTAVPTLTASGIPLATQTREAGAPIISSRVTANTSTTLYITPLSTTYLRFRFVLIAAGATSGAYCGWGHNSAQNTLASAIITIGKMKISWYSNPGVASAIIYNPQGGSIEGTWDVIFSAPFTIPTVKHNGTIVTGSGDSGRHNGNSHLFSWFSGLQSFEAWVN